MDTLLTALGSGLTWVANNPENVGIYVGTAIAIVGSIGALKSLRFKIANSIFKKFTLQSISVVLSTVAGLATAFLNLQPLNGTENVLYPIALVPAVKVTYMVVKAVQTWLNSFAEKRAAQEILVGNTLLPTTQAEPEEEATEAKLFNN